MNEQETLEPGSPIQRIEPKDPEVAFKEVCEQEPGRNIRLSCDLRLYQPSSQTYRYWQGASWKLELPPDTAVALELRHAFDAFISVVTKVGPAQTIALLTARP